jgi:hypothetical protein
LIEDYCFFSSVWFFLWLWACRSGSLIFVIESCLDWICLVSEFFF